MIRRTFWALVGIGLGAMVGLAIVRWMAKAKTRYAPRTLATGASEGIGALGARLRTALDAGVEEMERREVELRAEIGLP